jgi:2-oxoglutarate dehydrogenase E2 component (dihydrolipoamide succinyltransferase)
MSVELIVPTLGESITEATVSKWLKKVGESFEIDEALVEIETDKITVEVPAPSSGSLSSINVKEGSDINIGGVLGIIEEAKNTKSDANKSNVDQAKKEESTKPKNILKETNESKEGNISQEKEKIQSSEIKNDFLKLSPAVKKMITENKLDANLIKSNREDGRLTKEDVLNYMSGPKTPLKTSDREESVRMSKIRRTIATRLKDAQNTAAILTTFNEVDMSEIIKVRDLKKDDFMERYGVKLGFMSFFVKAVVMSLQEFPAVNAEIRDDNIIYKNHFDIGIAVGTEKGLVVPVLKNANDMTFGDIEKKIVELGTKAKEGSLTMEDLTGGTFTISNGGVYGSMLSTPIINRPQSGILGMHNIQKRAVVINDEIVIRPIMYLAFSYDHRIIDGKESVGFLINIKTLLENPSKIVLGI